MVSSDKLSNDLPMLGDVKCIIMVIDINLQRDFSTRKMYLR